MIEAVSISETSVQFLPDYTTPRRATIVPEAVKTRNITKTFRAIFGTTVRLV
jgi:hypothetical protein